MQTISFPFREHFVDLKLRQDADVLLPELIPAAPDRLAAVRRALAQPIGCWRLAVLARGKMSVAVVINDITGPAPTEILLTALVEELAEAGIGPERITVIVAGELEKAHLRGVEICEKAWVRRVPKAYDVVFVRSCKFSGL